MLIKDADELEISLDIELSWRLREISEIRSIVNSSVRETQRSAALRASIPTLYSHWEGFIKRSTELYIHHIFSQSLKAKDVRPEIAGYFLHSTYASQGGFSKKFGAAECINFYNQNMSRTLKSKGSININTKSNLRYDVLEKISNDIAISDVLYLFDENTINSRLCDKRNFIAHGQSVPVTLEEFEECRKEIADLMRIYKDRIITAAHNREYVVNASAA